MGIIQAILMSYGRRVLSFSAGQLIRTLTNPTPYGTSAGDEYGDNVAISGNYAIVGAPYEDSSDSTSSGKAYIYNVTTGALLYTLDNPNPSTNDYFGNVIAISGNYAIIGVPLEGVDGEGKAYIYDVTTGTLVYTLTDPNPVELPRFDNFGNSVSISGNYAIVGAVGERAISGGNYGASGNAYIYDVTTGSLVYTLTNPNAFGTPANDSFGYSVSISGNYAIVGAPSEADAGGTNSGKAYIFDATTGTLVTTLSNPNSYGASTDDSFGWAVSISGNYAIVRAPFDGAGSDPAGYSYIFNVTTGALLHTIDKPTFAQYTPNKMVAISGNYAVVNSCREPDDLSNPSSGKVYVFNVTTGAVVYTLTNPNAFGTPAYDSFGYSVAVSGDYIIVGAQSETDANGYYSGIAYIFTLANMVDGVPAPAYSAGQLVHTLSTASADQYYFGRSVAISGNYAIVGLYDNTTGGMVSLFDVTTGSLLRVLTNPIESASNNSFGYSVDISGNYAIVSNTGASDAGGLNSGKAYIYNVTTGALLYTLDNPNPDGVSVNDNFGVSVAISGNYAIVGSYVESGSGKAYIYDVTTGTLVYTLGDPNAYGASTNDYFGGKVSISGNYAIVGATGEDDASGTDSGKAYIFNVTTGSLVHTLDNPNPFGTSQYDSFSASVAISGNYAIVGAPGEGDAGGVTSGKAYIYNVTTGSLVYTLTNPNAYGTSEYDYFGVSVAISGNYAIVGAYDEDDAGIRNDSGKAYIFNITTGALVHTIDNPNAYDTPDYDEFGEFVAISGNYAIVGTRNEDDANRNSSGKAYIFTLVDIPA